jgi:DNA modification methylase
MAILIQLPNNASTSKYPKTFPHPLNLTAIWNNGDELLDLALDCFKKRQEEVFEILDKGISYLDSTDLPIVVNAGDFPPDAHYSKYYDYFFDKMTRPYLAMGTYSKLYRKKLEKRYRNFKFLKGHEDWDSIQTSVEEMLMRPIYDVIDYERYPKVDNKIRASIRASWGCPRFCKMCPVPSYFDRQYIYFDPTHVANIIKYLYDKKGVRYFTFIDDNLSYHPHFIKLLLKIRKMKLKGAKFHSQEGFDLGTFDIKRARLLKALNFDDIKIAFETTIDRTAELIGKFSINSENRQRALDVIKQVGLKVKSFMLLGLDETEDEIIENLRFFAKNNMTLRVNIIRDYPTEDMRELDRSSRMDDKTLKGYKALAYASSFFTETFGFNIFDDTIEDFLDCGKGYEYDGTTLKGKTKFGFQTSRFEKGIKYLLRSNIIENTGEKIEFKPRSENLEEVGEESGFTAGALKKSRKIRKEFLSKFGVEGKVPVSILIHDRKEYRYETIDLSAQRRGGNYVHHYRINRQKMHGREDYTPGLEKTGFETQGRTDYISGFPQNVGRFIIELYCPEDATIYDPFAGHNSRMQLCFKLGHNYIGVDCCKEFMEDNEMTKEILYERREGQLIKKDNWIKLYTQSSESIPEVEDESCDFTITSPPYWDLEYYGPEPEQLGTGKKYDEFLQGIARCIEENYRVLKSGAFCAWFINDFRKQKKFYPYHSHIYEILTDTGFEGFNIYIVDLGATVNHMFVQDIIKHKILPKRHEYCVLVKKP